MWDYISFWLAKEIAHFVIAVIIVLLLVISCILAICYIEWIYWPWKLRRKSLAAQYMYAKMLIHFQNGNDIRSVEVFVTQNYFPTVQDTARRYNKLASLTINRLLFDNMIESNGNNYVLTDKGKSKLSWAYDVRKATFYSK